MAQALVRPIIATALFLLVPLAAMQVTDEVKWSLSDFAIMGGLLFVSGLAYELIARRVRKPAQRAAAALAVGAVFVAVWLELAVGAVSKAFASIIFSM